MIEKYSFIVNGVATAFSTFSGMFLKEVTDTGAVKFDIATSTNPFIDGSTVNNRRAMSREITITFGYDLSLDPAVADEAVFSCLSTAFAMYQNINGDNVLTLKKEGGGLNKYIDCVVQSVEHLVYTDEPTLQIVLLADAFWYGDEITIEDKYVWTEPNYTRFDLSLGDVGSPFTLTIRQSTAAAADETVPMKLYQLSPTGVDVYSSQIQLPLATSLSTGYRRLFVLESGYKTPNYYYVTGPSAGGGTKQNALEYYNGYFKPFAPQTSILQLWVDYQHEPSVALYATLKYRKRYIR